MSTRGFFGYQKKGEIVGMYNHSSSYYGYLGEAIAATLMKYSWAEVESFFENNLSFTGGTSAEASVYDLLNLSWNNPTPTITEVENSSDFIWDGLNCEYGYVVNTDTHTLDVYRGMFINFPQHPNQPSYNGMGDINYYTHKVLSVKPEELPVFHLFCETKTDETLEEKLYPEFHVFPDRFLFEGTLDPSSKHREVLKRENPEGTLYQYLYGEEDAGILFIPKEKMSIRKFSYYFIKGFQKKDMRRVPLHAAPEDFQSIVQKETETLKRTRRLRLLFEGEINYSFDTTF